MIKTCSFNFWIALVTAAIIATLALPASAQPPLPPEQAATPPPAPPSPGHFQSPQPEYVPGEILVKFKPGTAAPGAQGALRARGLRAMDVSPDDGVMRVQVPPGQEAEAIAALAQREDVEIASYNHIIYATIDPNDPYYYSGYQWALAKIDAPGAWNMTTGSGDVIVAIVDSGLDTSHPEFSGRIVYPRDEIENDSQPQDTCEHGTHVAGIIAAQGNNGQGIAGMAWNVRIMPVRALSGSLSNCTGTEYDIRDGINWAVSHGAKVINLSLGALPAAGYTCEQQFPVMSQAITNAYQAGVLVVAAAGNNSTNRLACPGLQSDAMAVGATDSQDIRAYYSNTGTGLNVVAPGSGIYSTIPVAYGSYTSMTGTSMATPHVSGLAALIWSLSPDLTQDQVRDLIQSSADDLGSTGWDEEYGYGRINAARALQSAVTLQTIPAQVVFVVDDDSGPFPLSKQIQIATDSQTALSWNTSISPNDGWLGIAPPASGQVSASSAASFSLVASRPNSYGVHTANVTVTGYTLSGGVIGPAIIQVRISYVPDLQEFYLPFISKDGTP